MHFSHKEVRDLLLAWLMISIAFTVLFSNGLIGFAESGVSQFFIMFAVSFFTAGIGFLFHELMHKYVAQKYKLLAEFEAFYKMLWFAIGAAFFGFIFAAPGGVYIKGNITKERNGKISLAGPMTNVVLAVLFFLPQLLVGSEGIIGLFFGLGFRINALLAVFNLIPVMPFDGAKVIAWSKPVYFIVAMIAVALLIGTWVF